MMSTSRKGKERATAPWLSPFFDVLTAPYRPPSRLPKPTLLVHTQRCRNVVNWSTGTSEPRSEGSASTSRVESTTHQIYTPHGKWAWAAGKSMQRSKVLMHVGAGSFCSVDIKRGDLDNRNVTYINRRWATEQRDQWTGFYSELALYKSSKFLKPLQGDVVPTIINVYVSPGDINIAMEPPHPCFWIEASPGMPDILKERCIAAFEKIHARGVLHGDPELRHMLIGADAKVTIIDFQGSRALEPNDALGLLKAEPVEFTLEMRKVKFKLDYDGARKKELKKCVESKSRAHRNQVRREKHERRARGEDTGFISDYEEDPEDDKINPPVHKQDWFDHWVKPADAPPCRFVMPNQSIQTVGAAIIAFLDLIGAGSTEPGQSTSTPSDSAQGSSGPHGYNLRKRKAPYTESPENTKRSRTSEHAAAASDTVLTDSDSSLDVTPQTSADPPPPFVKVRDFAYEPHSGPRGYYVPHPPTEYRAARERAHYIRLVNAKNFTRLNLPHPAQVGSDCPDLTPEQEKRYKSMFMKSHQGTLRPPVQLGRLKRAWEDLADSGRALAKSKRRRLEYEVAKEENADVVRVRLQGPSNEVWEDMRMTTRDLPEIMEGPPILTRAEDDLRRAPAASSSSNGLRSALRKTKPVKTISHHRDAWLNSSGEKSPKLGPVDVHLSFLGNRAMQGVTFDHLVPLEEQRVEQLVKEEEGSMKRMAIESRMVSATLGLSRSIFDPPPGTSNGPGTRLDHESIDLTHAETPGPTDVGGPATSRFPYAQLLTPLPRKKVRTGGVSPHGARRQSLSPITRLRIRTRSASPPCEDADILEEEEVEALLPQMAPVEAHRPAVGWSLFSIFHFAVLLPHTMPAEMIGQCAPPLCPYVSAWRFFYERWASRGKVNRRFHHFAEALTGRNSTIGSRDHRALTAT